MLLMTSIFIAPMMSIRMSISISGSSSIISSSGDGSGDGSTYELVDTRG